jgi:hypothetical protein
MMMFAVMPRSVSRNDRTSENDESNQCKNNAANLHNAPLSTAFRDLERLDLTAG